MVDVGARLEQEEEDDVGVVALVADGAVVGDDVGGLAYWEVYHGYVASPIDLVVAAHGELSGSQRWGTVFSA